jgi:hypothetical protein
MGCVHMKQGQLQAASPHAADNAGFKDSLAHTDITATPPVAGMFKGTHSKLVWKLSAE